MLSSVRCGWQALPQAGRPHHAVLVVPGDQVGLATELVNLVIEAGRQSEKGIVVPTHGGRRGHPLLVSSDYREQVLHQYDNVGLRGLLWDHPEDVLEVEVASPGVLSDMDTPEDYASISQPPRDPD
jgi:molybdenum cofactor cytidylyltransferase